MTFYIGSEQELPLIYFDKDYPYFHTTELSKEENQIYKHISLEFILYFGSDQGCGCGFRHALLDHGEWFNIKDEETAMEENSQKNHQALYDYITTYVPKGSTVEIYGCWDGDINEHSKSTEKVDIENLLDANFYFRERGFYSLTYSGG